MWAVVVALAVGELADLAHGGCLQILRTDEGSDPTGSLVSMATAFGLLHNALTALLLAGLIACAVGDAKQRRAYATVAFATLAGWIAVQWIWLVHSVGDEFSPDEQRWSIRIAAVAHFGGAAMFVFAASRSGARRRLVRALAVGNVVGLIVFTLAELMRGGPFDELFPWMHTLREVVASLTTLAWVYVGLDLLGAFGDDGPAPIARVGGFARVAASGVAIGAIVSGVALAAVAVWVTDRVSSAKAVLETRTLGIVVFSVGALALQRMRGPRVPIVGWVTATAIAVLRDHKRRCITSAST
jgi:hypothetical protein